MTKKIKTKTNTKKLVKKSVNKKPKKNKDDNFGSSGILILGIIGIVVLIYFGANTDIEGNKAGLLDEFDSNTEMKTEKIA